MNSSSPPAPVGVTSHVSFAPDDLDDSPLSPLDFLPGLFLTENGYEILGIEDFPHLFDAPGGHSPNFLDDLPDSTSFSEQHLWLESHGFEPDNSMVSYSHALNPCPVCNSDGHVLYGRWDEDSTSPSYFCQKTRKRPDWSPAADAPPDPEIAENSPMEEDADPPPAGTASWTKVTSIEELKGLRRWIGVKAKKPLRYRPNNDPGKPLKGSTFSHRKAEGAKCGGFEGGIDAESFVRNGGMCLDHVSVSQMWDQKESRFRRMPRTTPRFESMGWAPYAQWEAFLEAKSGDFGISYCCTYNDAPNIVVVDIDYPKPKKQGEELDPVVAEAADSARDSFTTQLTAMGCPTCPSASSKGRRAAFTVANPDFYGSRHLIWRHPSGVNIELNPPGVARHVMLYALDGDLPELDPAAVDVMLTEQGFLKDTPVDTRELKGGKGLATFMEVCDREGWGLAFNEMSQTAFCNGVEQDDSWIHRTRSHLELNYVLVTEKPMPNGGTYILVSKFNVNEKLIHRWGIEAALLRNTYHPVRDWLMGLPA